MNFSFTKHALAIFIKLSLLSTIATASTDEDLKIEFSQARGYHESPFQLDLTANQTVQKIRYTTDSSDPSKTNGIDFTGEITISTTTVIKAIAFTENEESLVFTSTYLFHQDLIKQKNSPNGFPTSWGGSKIIDADYEMDQEIVTDPSYSTKLKDAFLDIPSLALSMDIDEWLNHETGMYVGYPDTEITREKSVSAEFIFPNKNENFEVHCGVQNQGGTSIVKWKVPKQSMRLLFKDEYGSKKLNYELLPDSPIKSINTLVVDGLLYSWLHPTSTKQRTTSLYFRDQLTSDLHNKMGGLSFHGIYVHLYLNGIYWGIYDLHERPDDAFMAEYLGGEREDWNVIKHDFDVIVNGSNKTYVDMLNAAQRGVVSNQSYDELKKHLDVDQFIDYMILNFYLGNKDWAHHNYYAASNPFEDPQWRYYTWDSELVMKYSSVDDDVTLRRDVDAPTDVHFYLKQNKEYRLKFADRVYKHCFNDGALTPDSFKQAFLYRKNEIDKAIILESARWGDYRKDVSNQTYTRNDHWIAESEKVIREYIPKRRGIVIQQLQRSENALYPFVSPPEIELSETENTTANFIDNNSRTGSIYYTIDGTDPRIIGGDISGTQYTDAIQLTENTIIKARFRSSHGVWSALAVKKVIIEAAKEDIVISEIMYNPAEDFPEFIELFNTGEQAVNLKDYAFTDGIEYHFKQNLTLSPNNSIVLTNDSLLFKANYEFTPNGQYSKSLSNKGEIVILRNNFNQIVDSINYSDSEPWPTLADGDGYSLELMDNKSDNALAASWVESAKLNGSPTRIVTWIDSYALSNEEKTNPVFDAYPNPFTNKITINQLVYSGGTEIYTVELYNQTGLKLVNKQHHFDRSLDLILGHLQTGFYLLKISQNEGSQLNPKVIKILKN